jgi:sigma-B regulation protein RsbU (phosphoserine phosphatase)
MNKPAPPQACRRVEALIARNRGDLIDRCREEILSRPRLAKLAQKLDVHGFDDWLGQAMQLFCMCVHPNGPATEWHDEVGELHVSAGLTISDAADVLAILRDQILALVWTAARQGEIERNDMSVLVGTILEAFDGALRVQASAYVRESQRNLQAVNRKLEVRQRVFERDLALAELVQQKFIPRSFRSKSFEAEVRYVPTSNVGGDHAGLFPVSEDCVYITICDVTGHGIASALVAEVVSAELRPLLRRQVDPMFQDLVPPVTVIRELNALFYREFQPLGVLLTFFVARVDRVQRTLTYAGAGHPPPLLQRPGTGDIHELRSQNIILGAAEDSILGDGEHTVESLPGDRVVFYTDGIIEAGDNRHRMLGLHGLTKLVKSQQGASQAQLADAILTEANHYAGQNASDDMTLILLDILDGA